MLYVFDWICVTDALHLTNRGREALEAIKGRLIIRINFVPKPALVVKLDTLPELVVIHFLLCLLHFLLNSLFEVPFAHLNVIPHESQSDFLAFVG